MDFEDFEFKPLTEGLGFHKKNASSSAQSEELPPLEPREKFDFEKSSALPKFDLVTSNINSNLNVELPEIAPQVDPIPSEIFSKPLPRTEQDVPKVSSVPISTIPKFNPRFTKPLSKQALYPAAIKDEGADLVSALSNRKEEATLSNKVDQTVEVKFVEVAPSALSLFLDLTVISGLSILFTLGLVVATHIDILPVLTHVATDVGTQVGLGLLIYSVSELYLILSRSFFGQTLGEWSMDTQLGLPEEQESISYIFKLISRTLVLTLTGFIFLPLISMIVGKDLAGRAASLKLYRR